MSGSSSQKIVETLILEAAAVPIDTTGAAVVGDYVSLRGARCLGILIIQGAWAGGTPAVTLTQATAVAGTGAKALEMTKMFQKVGLTGTVFAENAVAANTFNLPAVANTMTYIEVAASDLDADGGFDCAALQIASPGANADLIAAVYILGGLRYQGDPATLYDPKVD